MNSNIAQYSRGSRGQDEGAGYAACSDGGFREGDSETMTTAHVVAMEVDQGLNGLLHRGHLQQGHLAISGVENKDVDG